MIKELKIYWRLRPLISQFKELSNMPFSWNAAISFILMIAQGIIQVQDFIPTKYKWISAIAHLVTEFLLKTVAAYKNPDGTTAKLPWVPEQKENKGLVPPA